MLYLIAISLIVISFLYSTVGHGGASGYIAILTLFAHPIYLVRNDALVLNIIVSGIAFIQFHRAGFFNWKVFVPLIIGSIPLALYGGSLRLNIDVLKTILGILLFFTAILFLFKIKNNETNIRPMPFLLSILIGAVLGFVSGLSGIGGGIFLSPILLLGKWSGQKATAAISAPFIFVNSIAGLIGANKSSFQIDHNLGIFASACIIGGLLGSAAGAWKTNPTSMKRFLSVVLFIASIKLIIG